MKNIWISGGSSEIAQNIIAILCDQRKNQLDDCRIIVLSRQDTSLDSEYVSEHVIPVQVDWMADDLTESLKPWVAQYPPHQVFCCQGVLHNTQQMPEKNLRSIKRDWLLQSMDTNLWSHIALAQAIEASLSRRHSVRWLSLSAMVGSISDNRLGGWYSYRMSKAALNMLIKNLSIEWQRKNPDNIVAAVHPGTTDTELSQPFQKNIPAGKLYSAHLTAQRMLAVMAGLTSEDNGKLLHWDGGALPW